MAIRFSLNLKNVEELKKQLTNYPDKMRAVVLEETRVLAEEILTESKANHVPVDSGNLRASGYTKLEEVRAGVYEATVGFGGTAAPYALAVHENPRAGHTKGVSPSGQKYKHWAQTGHWKYLETPFLTMAPGLQDRIIEAAEKIKP